MGAAAAAGVHGVHEPLLPPAATPRRALLRRERASHSFHILPYYLARFICEMPLRIAQGLVFGERAPLILPA